jgi:peptide/nickel transport system permease protein
MKGLPLVVRRSPAFLGGAAMLSVVGALAVLAPWIAPYDPRAIPGRGLESPSSAHLLGTNDAGSDNLSRLIWGSRTTLFVAVAATALVLVIALALGLTAGLRGGFVDLVVMRITDVFLALPVLPLLIFVASLATPALTLSILLIGLFTWPPIARIVRSQTLSLRSRGFIRCAQGFGGGPLYVMRRHLVPALGPLIAVNVVQMAGIVIGIEAGLAFLGLGDPSAVSWGQDLERALDHPSIYIGSIWTWWLLPSGLAIGFTLFSLLLIGVGLEPWFNPRTSRALQAR